jgi:hypothetical protein
MPSMFAPLLLAMMFAAPLATFGVTVQRFEPRYETIRTRNSLRTDVMLYAPTVPPVDGAAVIFFSGHFGWRPIMQDTAAHFAANGRHVLAIESMKYFGKMLKPHEWAKDLKTFRTYINEKAGRPVDSPVILVGFTFGAEIIPYMLNRGGTEGFIGALLIGPGDIGAVLCRLNLQLDLPIPEEERFDVGQELADLPSMPIVLMEGTLDASSKAREMLPLVKKPRKYAPVAGGDRQFKETRDVYFQYTVQALDWIEGPHAAPEPEDDAAPDVAPAPADEDAPSGGPPQVR